MQQTQPRTETKYWVSPPQAAQVQQNVSALLPLDPLSVGDGYQVRSLYFDTLYDDDYYDKIDGVESRRKIRLRIYSPNSEWAKLELKEKRGEAQWKRGQAISRRQAQMLMEGRYSELARCLTSPFAQQLLARMESRGYLPKVLVEFRRKAYVEKTNTTRITLDSALQASETALDLFATSPAYYPVLCPTILEVKYQHFLLSHLRLALTCADSLPVAVSKYSLSRKISFC